MSRDLTCILKILCVKMATQDIEIIIIGSPILVQLSGFQSLSSPPLQPLTSIGMIGELRIARELILLP